MTLQISTRKLLKQEIRQNGWMFGITALGHLLSGPVVFLLYTSNHANWTMETAHQRYHAFFTDVYFIWQLLAMLGCLCVAVFTYRYLFSRRMVDLYHSVPISRNQLFLVKYLHGLLIWLIPFIISATSIMLFCLIRTIGQPYQLELLETMLRCVVLLIICFIVFYHLFLTAVYLSGNTINMFTNLVIIGCSVIAISSACFACAGYFFNTFCYTPTKLLTDILYGLSPLATPFAMFGYLASSVLSTDHVPLVIISMLTSLGMLGIAWILCQKRPSELAERGTIAKHYTAPARIAASVLVGIAGSLFFSEIVSNDQQLPWGIFGALLSSTVTFGVINSIFRTTIKAFFRHKIQMILSTVCSIGIILIFQLDLFGYDAYLPDKEEIAGVAIYTSQLADNSTYARPSGTSGIVSIPRSNSVVQEDLLTDTDICYNLLDALVNDYKTGSYTSYYTKVKLKNGRIYERRYKLSDEQYELTQPFFVSESYQKTNYKYSIGTFGYPQKLNLDLQSASIKLNEGAIAEFMDAYWADFNEHYSLEEQSSYIRIFGLSGQYICDDDYWWLSLDVHDNYSRTLAVLEKLYPEYTSDIETIETPEAIKELTLYADSYEIYSEYGYNIEALYRHFGYDVPEVITPLPEPETSDTGDRPTMTVVETASAIPQTFDGYTEVTISDPEMIAELYPLLTFGNYRDIFEQKDYIYIGRASSNKKYDVDCYVKPGTLPEEIIKMLFEALEVVEE